jgi:hypothetical protein
LLETLRISRDGNMDAASKNPIFNYFSQEQATKMLQDMRDDDPMFIHLKEALLAESETF